MFTSAPSDFFREFVLVGSALGVLGFGGVGEEAAFNQHGRDGRSSQNIKAAPSHTAVASGRSAGHVIMNGGSERQTLRTIKVRLNSTRRSARRGIEVNTNKNRVAIRISDCNAGSQRDEDVTISRHHDAIPVGSEHCFEAPRYIEIHYALR